MKTFEFTCAGMTAPASGSQKEYLHTGVSWEGSKNLLFVHARDDRAAIRWQFLYVGLCVTFEYIAWEAPAK
jgi:hypothetical protein